MEVDAVLRSKMYTVMWVNERKGNCSSGMVGGREVEGQGYWEAEQG